MGKFLLFFIVVDSLLGQKECSEAETLCKYVIPFTSSNRKNAVLQLERERQSHLSICKIESVRNIILVK